MNAFELDDELLGRAESVEHYSRLRKEAGLPPEPSFHRVLLDLEMTEDELDFGFTWVDAMRAWRIAFGPQSAKEKLSSAPEVQARAGMPSPMPGGWGRMP